MELQQKYRLFLKGKVRISISQVSAIFYLTDKQTRKIIDKSATIIAKQSSLVPVKTCYCGLSNEARIKEFLWKKKALEFLCTMALKLLMYYCHSKSYCRKVSLKSFTTCLCQPQKCKLLAIKQKS